MTHCLLALIMILIYDDADVFFHVGRPNWTLIWASHPNGGICRHGGWKLEALSKRKQDVSLVPHNSTSNLFHRSNYNSNPKSTMNIDTPASTDVVSAKKILESVQVLHCRTMHFTAELGLSMLTMSQQYVLFDPMVSISTRHMAHWYGGYFAFTLNHFFRLCIVRSKCKDQCSLRNMWMRPSLAFFTWGKLAGGGCEMHISRGASFVDHTYRSLA
jgi:hypothetical protein